MKKAILFTCFILAAVSSFHCRKRIEAGSLLVGEWRALKGDEGMQTIIIKSDGTGRYQSVTTDRDDYDKVRMGDNDFKIGLKHFEILEGPTTFDTTGFHQTWMYNLYPASAPPTLKMKLHLPFFWGNFDLVFYKWEF